MLAGTRLDLVLMALLAAVSAVLIFSLMTAFVVAVSFGPRDRPAFIARNAWMFTRPVNPVEWFGLGVAAWIALMALLLPFSMTTKLAGADYGPIGRGVLFAAYVPMAMWVVYLVWVYRRLRS